MQRVGVALDPGGWRVRCRLDTPSIISLAAETDEGVIPLPLARDGPVAESVFAATGPIGGFHVTAVEPRTFEAVALEIEPVRPWLGAHTLAPDWCIGPLRFPGRRPDGREKDVTHGGHQPLAMLSGATTGWDRRIRIIAAEAVTVGAGGRLLLCGPLPILRLGFDPPLGLGRWRIAGRFRTSDGRPALVAPRLLSPAATSPVDALGQLRRTDGSHHAATFDLAARTEALLLRPREHEGAVAIEALSVTRVLLPARFGAAAGFIRAAVRQGFLDASTAGGFGGRGPSHAVDRRPVPPDHGRDRLPATTGDNRSSASVAPAGLPDAGGNGRPAASVSIVTATRDAPDHLARFLATLGATTARPFELVLVDNGTTDRVARAILAAAAATPDVRVLHDDRRFNFAALSNLGAAHATGEVLVFANNDIAFTDPAWLGPLVDAALDPRVGVAGARLLYPDGRVQHAGLVLAGEARVRHAERFLAGSRPGFRDRQRHPTRVAAVTGALMAIRTGLFRTLGGFDAARYPVLLNDADLCLRALERGLHNVLVPASVAIHHESATIGPALSAGLFSRGGPLWRYERAVEETNFRASHADRLDADPCYPAGLDPHVADFRRRL